MNVFQFNSYKEFITTYVKSLPSKGRGELSRISIELGIHNTTLSQILNGDKNINLEQGLKLSKYLNLDENETEFLFHLISLDRSNDDLFKKYLKTKIQKIRKDKDLKLNFLEKPENMKLNDNVKARFYSSWDFSAVRVMTAIGEGLSTEDLSERLQLPKDRVKQVLNFLLNSGLCTINKHRYSPGPIHTHLDANDISINSHRTNWRAKAIEKAGRLSDNEFMFSAPMSISANDFDEIKLSINRLTERAIKKAKNSEAEFGACLNIDWFKFSN